MASNPTFSVRSVLLTQAPNLIINSVSYCIPCVSVEVAEAPEPPAILPSDPNPGLCTIKTEPESDFSIGSVHDPSSDEDYQPRGERGLLTAEQDKDILEQCQLEYRSDSEDEPDRAGETTTEETRAEMDDVALMEAVDNDHGALTLKPDIISGFRYTNCRKKSNCFYCNQPQSRLIRHLQSDHGHEDLVAAIRRVPRVRKKRALWTLLRNRGNHAHNVKVIKKGRGLLRVYASSKPPGLTLACCPLCQGYFLTSDIRTHWCAKKGFLRRCGTEPERDTETLARILTPALGADDMDPIGTIRNDPTVLAWGLRLVAESRHCKRRRLFNTVREKLKQMGLFLLLLRNWEGLENVSLAEALDSKNVPSIVEAARETASGSKDSLRQLMLTLSECALFCKVECLERGSRNGARNFDEFLRVFVPQTIAYLSNDEGLTPGARPQH